MGRQRGGASAQERYTYQTAAVMAKHLPQHFKQVSDLPVLTEQERDSLAQCEAAVETLKWAFWLAGKALHIIRDGRLYRVEHETFDDYVQARWGMQANYAHKLIRTWRIAEALFEQESNSLVPIGTTRGVNQAQVWELVDVAEAWDVDRAAWVYRTVVDVDGVAVTAQVLKGAVKALPSMGEAFDETTAAAAIRAYLAGLDDEPAPADPRAVVAQRVRRAVKALDADTVRQAAADPETRQVLRQLLAVLAEYDQDDGGQDQGTALEVV